MPQIRTDAYYVRFDVGRGVRIYARLYATVAARVYMSEHVPEQSTCKPIRQNRFQPILSGKMSEHGLFSMPEHTCQPINRSMCHSICQNKGQNEWQNIFQRTIKSADISEPLAGWEVLQVM